MNRKGIDNKKNKIYNHIKKSFDIQMTFFIEIKKYIL